MAGKPVSQDPRFDKRVLDRNLARGVVTKQEVEKHLSSLKDVADHADNIADLVYGNEGATQKPGIA